MFTKNNGSNEHDILQNQFTAFLTVAVSNARIDYLRARIRRLQRELVTEEYEILFSEDHDYIEALSDNDALRHAMREIKEKERYVVLARILDEKGFDEIADELDMGYKLRIPDERASGAVSHIHDGTDL